MTDTKLLDDLCGFSRALAAADAVHEIATRVQKEWEVDDKTLLDDLHLLGQWLQGLGEGPQPADEEALLGYALAMLLLFINRIRDRRKELADERAQHD